MRKALILVPALALAVVVLAPLASAPLSQQRPAADRASVEWRVEQVGTATLAARIADARRYLAAHRGTHVVLLLPAGVFDLSGSAEAADAMIDVSGVDACPGKLELRGAGMRRTTLVRNPDTVGVLGRGAACVTIADLTLSQRRLEASQGRVVSSSPTEVVVDIPQGFPTFADLTAIPAARDPEDRPRYWLKRYATDATGVHLVEGERAMRWSNAVPVNREQRRWRVSVVARRGTPDFRPGDLVGIKAKSGGQAYRFVGGHDITFARVRWVGDARGKFRDVDRVTVRECAVEAPAPINGVPVLMSTSGGGPQIGHASDRPTTGHLVENNSFEGTGDDAIAFANASGVIRNNRIRNVSRGIFVVGSPDVNIEGNVLDHAPVVRRAAGKQRRSRMGDDGIE